jgi:phage shock protein A
MYDLGQSMSDARSSAKGTLRAAMSSKVAVLDGLRRCPAARHAACDGGGRRPKPEDNTMNRLRLWTSSLLSRVDWMVTQVENHEALAESAIREVRQAGARAKVQLGRVRQDGERLRDSLAAQVEAEQRWRERARRTAAHDEARALECLRRSRAAARRATELERRVDEHDRVEQQLVQDVSAIGERLGRLEEQRNLLRTRQSRAEALSHVRAAEPGLETGDLFDRWETRVLEREFESACPTEATLQDDAFETEFDEVEEAESLREELSELLAKEDHDRA